MLSGQMQVRFYLDPETNLPHIYHHHVTEDEVEDILSRPGEDRPVPNHESDSVFVITAYELRGKPLFAYRKRKKRRKK